MASRSCEVFVAGVDEKLMAYLEEFYINADGLSSDSKSDGFSSDSSEGIVLDTPPKFLKRRRLNLDASNLSLSNAGDENISNNDISDREINEGSFCNIPADQNDTFPTLPISFMEHPGPKHAPHPESSPITYFEIFFTSALLNLIVAETNRYEIGRAHV